MMEPRALLRAATKKAELGFSLTISTKVKERQPLPGYRAELLSVGSNGSWNWRLSPRQVLRLEKQLRAELRDELRAECRAALAEGE